MSICYLKPSQPTPTSISETFLGLQQLPALPQPQVKKIQKLRGGAIVKVTDDQREKLKKISGDNLQRLEDILGHQWVKNRGERQNIPMYIAIVIDTIAGEIFDFKKITIKDVHRFLIHQDQLDELKYAMDKFGKKMRDKISGIEDGSVKSISLEDAKKFNPHLVKKFTCASAKTYAEQEASEKLKASSDLPAHSTGTKRKLSSSEDPALLSPSKEQRTAATNETLQTESFLPEEQFSSSPIDSSQYSNGFDLKCDEVLNVDLNCYEVLSSGNEFLLNSENELVDWRSWDYSLRGAKTKDQ